jgi:DNA adenine methylase
LIKADRKETFFYLDPPYFKKPLYRFNFEERDYIELAECLRALKGKFLLSLNDTPETRRIFAAFTIKTLQMTYTAQRKVGKKFQELLISNYALPSRIN